MVTLWLCHLLILLLLSLEMIRQQDLHIQQGLTHQFKILFTPHSLQESHRREHSLEQQMLIPQIILLILLGIQEQVHRTTQETHGLHIPPGRAPQTAMTTPRGRTTRKPKQ